MVHVEIVDKMRELMTFYSFNGNENIIYRSHHCCVKGRIILDRCNIFLIEYADFTLALVERKKTAKES